ncbi:MAG: hypothetical protein FIB07_15635 [Candidatus Methanoperedens sp.]|nr:hypothetical protein [Candidatus Methanoperedens sp.]
MIEKTCSKRNCISTMKDISTVKGISTVKSQKRKRGNDIDFDQVVKFLNDQKAVMDHADLN